MVEKERDECKIKRECLRPDFIHRFVVLVMANVRSRGCERRQRVRMRMDVGMLVVVASLGAVRNVMVVAWDEDAAAAAAVVIGAASNRVDGRVFAKCTRTTQV